MAVDERSDLMVGDGGCEISEDGASLFPVRSGWKHPDYAFGECQFDGGKGRNLLSLTILLRDKPVTTPFGVVRYGIAHTERGYVNGSYSVEHASFMTLFPLCVEQYCDDALTAMLMAEKQETMFSL